MLAEAKLREKKAQSQKKLLEAGSQLQVAALCMLNRQQASANGFLGPYTLDAPRLSMDGSYYTEATMGLFAGIDLNFWDVHRSAITVELSLTTSALRSFTTVFKPAIRCLTVKANS